MADALRHPNRDAAGLPIIALPYLVLLKLEAGRAVDLGDLSRMLGGTDEAALAAVRRVVRAYLPDAIEDVESLIQVGRLEYAAEDPAPAVSPAVGERPSDAVRVRALPTGTVVVREH